MSNDIHSSSELKSLGIPRSTVLLYIFRPCSLLTNISLLGVSHAVIRASSVRSSTATPGTDSESQSSTPPQRPLTLDSH